MSTYDGFRQNGGPTLYGSMKTSVTADVLEAGLIFAAVILAFSLLIVLPGIRGKQVSGLVAVVAAVVRPGYSCSRGDGSGDGEGLVGGPMLRPNTAASATQAADAACEWGRCCSGGSGDGGSSSCLWW